MQNPYDLTFDEQGYKFVTESGVSYRIVFEDLDPIFYEYPVLQGRVFSFSFYPVKKPGYTGKPDGRIKHTIAKAIRDFFLNHNNVIVFVCDSSDKRELYRKKLFDTWFRQFNNGALEKYDGSVGREGDMILNAIIVKADLPDKVSILPVFHSLNHEFSRAK